MASFMGVRTLSLAATSNELTNVQSRSEEGVNRSCGMVSDLPRRMPKRPRLPVSWSFRSMQEAFASRHAPVDVGASSVMVTGTVWSYRKVRWLSAGTLMALVVMALRAISTLELSKLKVPVEPALIFCVVMQVGREGRAKRTQSPLRKPLLVIDRLAMRRVELPTTAPDSRDLSGVVFEKTPVAGV